MLTKAAWHTQGSVEALFFLDLSTVDRQLHGGLRNVAAASVSERLIYVSVEAPG
jgi:hypothetical protein